MSGNTWPLNRRFPRWFTSSLRLPSTFSWIRLKMVMPIGVRSKVRRPMPPFQQSIPEAVFFERSLTFITLIGKIYCRLQSQSEELRHFGEYLAQRTIAEGPLSLIIHSSPSTKRPLADVPLFKMVEAMKIGTLLPQSVSFSKNRAVTAIQMEIQFGDSEPSLISGFPRSFSSDLDSGHNRQPRDMHRHSHRSPLSSQYTSPPRSRDIGWEPPPRLDGLPHIDLGHYADPTRNLGGRRLKYRSRWTMFHGVDFLESQHGLSDVDAEMSGEPSSESSEDDEVGWDWRPGH